MKSIFGNQIRIMREKAGLTQETVASAIGMTRQRYDMIEKGVADISYDIICRIANFFEVSTREITDACESVQKVQFKSGGYSVESFEQIEEMIAFFYANKSLYYRVNNSNVAV